MLQAAPKPKKEVYIPMDYSTCGYHASEQPIPDVRTAVSVKWQAGDCADVIQQAINQVAAMKPDANGHRGAIVLDAGVFAISRPLRISASGIVLRGMGHNKTKLLKQGVERGAMIYVSPSPNPSPIGRGEQKASPLRGGLVGAEASPFGGGKEGALIWARAAWAGCQRYPVHWGGDSESSWAGMAGSLKGGLHLGLSGFAFWSHDVPGFHSTPDFMNSPLDEQVYVRWTQFGVFTSHIRYHGTCKREPWHYPAIAPIVKRWWKLRYRLIPYIVEQSQQACQSGFPIIQALLIRHPHDRQVWHIDDEYYFGQEFLVCPVMNGNNRRDIYLPGGAWINFFTGERFEGGRWYYGVDVPLDQMPVFVRPGASIRMYPHDVDSTDDMDLSQSVTIEITDDFKGIGL